jgi:hypothetical protein
VPPWIPPLLRVRARSIGALGRHVFVLRRLPIARQHQLQRRSVSSGNRHVRAVRQWIRTFRGSEIGTRQRSPSHRGRKGVALCVAHCLDDVLERNLPPADRAQVLAIGLGNRQGDPAGRSNSMPWRPNRSAYIAYFVSYPFRRSLPPFAPVGSPGTDHPPRAKRIGARCRRVRRRPHCDGQPRRPARTGQAARSGCRTMLAAPTCALSRPPHQDHQRSSDWRARQARPTRCGARTARTRPSEYRPRSRSAPSQPGHELRRLETDAHLITVVLTTDRRAVDTGTDLRSQNHSGFGDPTSLLGGVRVCEAGRKVG